MHHRPPLLPLLLLGAAASLAPGCRLVDQRTFEAAGLYPRGAQLQRANYAARELPVLPYAVVRMGTPGADWRGPLLAASRAAQGRKPDVTFDLVTPLPSAARMGEQDQVAQQGAQDAVDVATALEADGVSPDHIHIGARGDAGQPPREVEVYVR